MYEPLKIFERHHCRILPPNPTVEHLGPLSDDRLPRLPEDYRSEINLRALDWLEDVARRLERGYVLTIDYGFEREEWLM